MAGSHVAAQSRPSFSAQDLAIVARALPFVHPALSGEAWAAVAFDPGDSVSQREAERIVYAFGAGVRSGDALLRARIVPADALGTGDYAFLIAAAGAPGDLILAAARARHVVCITPVLEQVEAGQCAVWLQSTPRVRIVVSRSAVQATSLGLAPAFRLMVREL